MAKIVLLNIHLFASIIWVGSVYMGAFIDWPAAKKSVKPGQFPFEFIVGQGSKVFVSVYTGIFFLWTSGIGLLMIHPPQAPREILIASIKGVCLFLMTAFTMYGTFSTWRKLQVATHQEAFALYKYYMYRAYGTFSFGMIASILGLWLY
jgi:uncharacterized membrane protein